MPDVSSAPIQYDVLHLNAERLLKQNLIMVDDFPIAGIRYLDFYRIFDVNPSVRSAVVSCFVERYRDAGIDGVASIGTGGFTLGSLVAHSLDLPMYPIRKMSDTVHEAYSCRVDMIYAKREMTFSKNIPVSGKRIVIVDDTIATGGTFEGAIKVLNQAGAEVVELAAVFETTSKRGRARVHPTPLYTILAQSLF